MGHLHFGDIHSLSVLAVHLDSAQPILDVLADYDYDDGHDIDGDDDYDDNDSIRYHQYHKLLIMIMTLSVDHDQHQNALTLTLPLIVQHMMTNIGAKQTIHSLSHPIF